MKLTSSYWNFDLTGIVRLLVFLLIAIFIIVLSCAPAIALFALAYRLIVGW